MRGSAYTATSAAAAQFVPPSTKQEVAPQANAGMDHRVVTVVILLVVYAVWAFVAMHQRVRESVQPRNIAINVYNLVLITLTVVLGLALTKIALAKMALLHVPGAQAVLDIVDAS